MNIRRFAIQAYTERNALNSMAYRLNFVDNLHLLRNIFVSGHTCVATYIDFSEAHVLNLISL